MTEVGAPRWLTILGIGEDGVEGLTSAARTLISAAELVVGGERHLALAADLIRGETLAWPRPLALGLDAVMARRGRAVVVLASGDPFDHGVGVQLAERASMAELLCLPAPSAVSLACARLGWARANVSVASLCGGPLARLAPNLQPGRKVLALSADATTPAAVAAYLTERGFGPSRLYLLEALGGPAERVSGHLAETFDASPRPLNLVGLEIVATPDARVIPVASGLADDLFEHDGQITKREIRALTLSALAPRAGERLWDIGCGSGSVSIEWMLSHPANTSIAFEADPVRAARAARNAASLGVPDLRIERGRAPSVLAGLPQPDAVFIGGGARDADVIAAAWSALRSGGRLVANAVTLQTETALGAARERFGGGLTRLSVERLESVGRLHAFRPAMSVTQWAAVKP
jgi:precorrin-6Y C5,15-methyltransferase (decarboxylating)